MNNPYHSKSYALVRIAAQILFLLFIERGYHLFHYVGASLHYVAFGYIWGPLTYSAVVMGIMGWHKKWLISHDYQTLSLVAFKDWLVNLGAVALIWPVVAVALLLGSDWLWAKYWNIAMYSGMVYINAAVNFSNWLYYYGHVGGILVGISFYLTLAVKIYIALNIGNLAYLAGSWLRPNLARLFMALGCLLTFGLSETLYFGNQSGAYALLATAIAMVLTLANPAGWPFAWLYIFLSSLI